MTVEQTQKLKGLGFVSATTDIDMSEKEKLKIIKWKATQARYDKLPNQQTHLSNVFNIDSDSN